jgi:hypothetical protein
MTETLLLIGAVATVFGALLARPRAIPARVRRTRRSRD